MKIYNVTDKEFTKYGKVLDVDTTEIVKVSEKIEYPEKGSAYFAMRDELQGLDITGVLEKDVFGEMSVQMGYCCGYNSYLNAVEWHKSSEVNIAITDMVLILGEFKNIEDGKYDSSKCEAFLVKKGQCVEVYAHVLHYCPCQMSDAGFGCVIVLPKGTNLDLKNEPKDKTLYQTNKWILVHKEYTDLNDKGVVCGVIGENYKIEY